jgi:hypothetical protein
MSIESPMPPFRPDLSELELLPEVWPEGEGRKDDGGKAPFHLIPPEALFALASVLAFGATKYGENNWRRGMKWSRPFSAAMRHLWCWWAGKAPTPRSFLFDTIDGETSFSHLWHALACVVFLVSYEERRTGEDDRFGG